jgi:hypothetical protein
MAESDDMLHEMTAEEETPAQSTYALKHCFIESGGTP